MKQSRKAVALLLFLPLLLAACDDFERNAFRTLKLAKVEYQLLQEHTARAFVHGRLTPGQWDSFSVAGNRFIAAHTLAADLMESYRRVQTAGDDQQTSALQARIESTLARLPVLLSDLRILLAGFNTASTIPPD